MERLEEFYGLGFGDDKDCSLNFLINEKYYPVSVCTAITKLHNNNKIYTILIMGEAMPSFSERLFPW